MTVMRPALELILDANVVFLAAFAVWALIQAGLVRSRLRTDYGLQLRLLRVVLLMVIVSPVLTLAVGAAGQAFWPKVPMTVSDLAVAAYLRGDIAMPALRFEALLNLRGQLADSLLSGDLPWLAALLSGLALGTAVLLARTAATVFRVRGVIAASHVWRRTRRTDVRLSDTVAVPFAARGLLRRHVVLPSRLLLHPREMRIVLAHEFEHLREGDVEWEMAFELLRPFLYWNPAFVLWKRAFGRLRELNCDRAVLQSLRMSPREYARCLLAFCGRRAAARPVEALNVAFVRVRARGARQALEARLLALAEARAAEHRSAPVFWLAALVLAAGVALAALSVRSAGDWSQDRLMLSTIVNLERLEAINRGF